MTQNAQFCHKFDFNFKRFISKITKIVNGTNFVINLTLIEIYKNEENITTDYRGH